MIFPQRNISLTDSSLLTLLIASAIVFSKEIIFIFFNLEASSESGIVSVTTISSRPDC